MFTAHRPRLLIFMDVFLRWLLLATCLLTGCRDKAARSAPAIEAYVWQASERPEVAEAMAQSVGTVSTLHIRAAELRWTGKAFEIERRVKDTLPIPDCGLVLRIGASASRLDWTAEQIGTVSGIVRELASLRPREIQCDYDCPQKRLSHYQRLLAALQAAAKDVPVIPTALPAWLDEPAFPALVKNHPGYVLQVHSLQLPKQPDQPVVIYDPAAARTAAKRASAIGVPFRIAMATYGCEVWFGPDGKIMEVISEDAPPAGRVPARRSFALADPVESARLVREWNAAPPAGLRALVWYRLPIESDRRNWPWETFRSVVRGEDAPSDLTLLGTDHDGAQDLHVVNRGKFPVPLPETILIRNPVIAADGAGAYHLDRHEDGLRLVRRESIWPWLDPGKKIPAGWLRTRGPVQRIDWHFTP